MRQVKDDVLLPSPPGRGAGGEGRRSRFFAGVASCIVLLLCVGCGATGQVPVPDREGVFKTAADERALRRAYDGAPPVIPHENFGIDCIGCHDLEGVDRPVQVMS